MIASAPFVASPTIHVFFSATTEATHSRSTADGPALFGMSIVGVVDRVLFIGFEFTLHPPVRGFEP